MDDRGAVPRPAELADAALYANTYKAMATSVAATGFRTNATRYRTLSHSSETRLADEFLVATRLRRHDRETEATAATYFSDAGLVLQSMFGEEAAPAGGEVPLPEGAPLRMELGEAIGRRRSIRNFAGDAIELPYLATLLRATGAVTVHATADHMGGGHSVLRYRTVPSAGGMYPVAVWLAALRVRGLDAGLYRYDPMRDALAVEGGQSVVERLRNCFAVPDEAISVSRAGAILYLVARPWRSMRKYGNRGMRYVFHETGGAAQNVALAATALGLGTVDVAGVYDDEAHEALGVDGVFQTLTHTIVIGQPG